MERERAKDEPHGQADPRGEKDDAGHRPATPPAGPHQADHLTDDDRTPGTGALPGKSGTEGDVDAGTG
jgi:hypothetical protein